MTVAKKSPGCRPTCRAGEMAVGSPVSQTARQPSSALLAAACDDLAIRVFDVEVRSDSEQNTLARSLLEGVSHDLLLARCRGAVKSIAVKELIEVHNTV